MARYLDAFANLPGPVIVEHVLEVRVAHVDGQAAAWRAANNELRALR